MACSSLPSAGALVSHTCLPRITGDDQALPLIETFHATFVFSSHFTGRPFESDLPSPAGPRKAGQSSLANAVRGSSAARAAMKRVCSLRMEFLVLESKRV